MLCAETTKTVEGEEEKRELQVIRGIKNVYSSGSEIRTLIGELEKHLDSVLRAPKPSVEESAKDQKEVDELVALAANLRETNLINRESIQKLNSILIRLEL